MSICDHVPKSAIIALRLLLLIAGLLVAAHPVEVQAYNLKEVVIKGGGFVTGIVTHPNASGLMYCRTDTGGAYRWNPTNGSWIPLQDFLGPTNNEFGLFGGESIALDPQDTNRLYMTCGWLGSGGEIWTSTNQGATFTRISAPFTLLANSEGRSNGERLAVDPNLGSILFNGTRLDGLWKSLNYGASWSKVTNFPVNTTTNQVGLVFVEFNKNSGVNGSATPEIWVGVSQGTNNLYRSTDGGASWSVVPNGADPIYMPHRASQDGLGNMYITFNDEAGPNDVNAGSVVKINLSTLAATDVTPPTGQGGFGGVSVDKQHPSTLVACTMGRWYPHDEVYRSTNGGTNWTACYGTTPIIDSSSAPWITFDQTNAPVSSWIGDIKIDPFNSDHVYHISGRGVWSSYNLTSTNPTWEFRSDGIEEMGLWGGGGALCSPPSGALFFCAFGDIGGFADHNPDVSPPKSDHFFPFFASNTSLDFAEQNPNIVVRTHYGNNPNGSTANGGGRSTDGGKTWTEFPTHPSAATNDPGVISISPDGTRLVWVSEGSPASYSTNNGATWTQCGGNITPTNSWELPLLFSDRVNSSKFYLYMPETGVVNVSTNGGATFVAGATVGTWCSSMRTVYGQEGDIWISGINTQTSKPGLWHSTNSGASFTKLSGVQNALCVGFGRTASGSGYPVLYMNGQVTNTWGIYKSEDTGATWMRLNDNQHQYSVTSQITGDPKIYGRCYFDGRGLIYGDISSNTISTVGSVNENNQTILEATGNSLTHARFASNIATAFANDAGGVWNFDAPSFSAVSGGTITLNYGASLTNSLVLTLTEGTGGTGINQAYVPGEATSGDYELGINGTAATRTFTPNKPLLTVGIFNTDRGDATRTCQLTVTYQDNTTASTSGANAGSVYFHGLSGTASNLIVSFAISQNNFVRYDDLGFIVAPVPEAPYGGTPWSLPGVIQAANYDVGGQGVGYYDTNEGGSAILYRSDEMDNIEPCGDVDGGYDIGWSSAGQWFNYTVNVPYTGAYAITLRVASYSTQIQGHVDVDGTNVTGTMTSPTTGGWQTYTNMTATNVTLTAGLHVMQVNFDVSTWNLHEISITALPLPAPTNLTAAPGNGQIALSWNSVSGATNYSIQRSGSGTGTYTNLATALGANYIDSGLAAGATWYYTVAASGLSGIGATSAPVSATTYSAQQNWRLTYFGTISNSGNAADSADPYGVGMNNLQEFEAGTDPTSWSSVLHISQLQVSGNNMLVSFASVAGKTYRVDRSDTLQNGSWVTVQDNIAGTGSTIQITDSGAASLQRCFYRVVVH